jgi:hypothetical protein
MPNLSLSAVSVGIYTAMNVAGLTALVGTRIYDELPRIPTYPCIDYTVSEDDHRGLGSGELNEISIRVSVLSQSETAAEAQAICKKVKELLKDVALTVTGYKMAGLVVWKRTYPVGDTEINGEKVHETIVDFTAWVEPS